MLQRRLSSRGSTATAIDGLGVGFVVGLFFVATSFGLNHAFAQRSLKLWTIDAGYHIVQFFAVRADPRCLALRARP